MNRNVRIIEGASNESMAVAYDRLQEILEESKAKGWRLVPASLEYYNHSPLRDEIAKYRLRVRIEMVPEQ